MRNQSETVNRPNTSTRGTAAPNPMETIIKSRHHFRSLDPLAIVCFAGFLLVAANAVGAPFATISILDSATGSFTVWAGSDPASFSFIGLDLTGGDKLVVSIGGEGTQSATPWSSVTFDGVAMTEAARRGAGPGIQSGIYYLDNLTGLSASGNLTISADVLNSRGLAATAWVLSGTAAGHGASGASDGASTSLTTAAADSWVLAHATVFGTTVPVAQSPLTAGDRFVWVYNGADRNSIATGYQTVLAQSGGVSLTPTFDIGDTTVAAAFKASLIPEPSTMILTGLGLAGLALRWRRK